MPARSTARRPPSQLDLVADHLRWLKATKAWSVLRVGVHMARGVEAYLRAKGVIVLPLIPEKELSACQRAAIATLAARDPGHDWGDYLEFGVFQGHSMSLMFRNLAELDLLDRVRLYGFDSFEGYPREAMQETFNGYLVGADKAEMHVAERVLTKRGVDWRRVKLVKGWFSDTLTPEFRASEGITRVSLVNFDCDLYVSTAQALAFVGPLLHKSAIFFFDDWGDEELVNQKKAFAEFLKRHHDVVAEELPNYSFESRVFYVSRDPAMAAAPWQARLRMMA